MNKNKLRDAAGAIDAIKSGMTVAIGHLGAEPTAISGALWNRTDLHSVTIVSGMMLTGYPFLASSRNDFSLKTWFMPGTLSSSKDARQIRADYLPMNWTQTARYLASGVIDVALVQVGKPDKSGFHSLGISTSQHLPMIKGAKLVIAEVNEAMPRTGGQSLVHESEFDILVHEDHPLIPFPNRSGDEIDNAIGARAAAFIEDGSTIQFGIGAIPSVMFRKLRETGRRDILIWSQITDPVRDFMDSGGCRQTGPKAIVGEILGSSSLYDWSHENSDICMTDAFATHSLRSLAEQKKFVSVNSALEIDLYGQVNSETLDGRQVGAIGGSMDYAMAAQFDGNLSVIALRARTKRGEPRIVPLLKAAPATVPRSLVQVVVTEHGAVDLRGKTMRERAHALAQIAHPDDREQLERYAFEIE